MRKLIRLVTIAAVFVSGAMAIPITFTYSGTGSGSIGGTAFTDQQFLITAVADTDNITPWVNANNGPQLTHDSATIQIAGFGLATFTIATHTWHNPEITGGFGVDLGPNLITISEPGWDGYGLNTNFGPLVENNPVNVNQFANRATTLGNLTFTSMGSVTFEATTGATTIPEPSSAMLVLAALACAAGLRRRTDR